MIKKGILLFMLISLLLTGCAGAEERAWKSGQKALAKEKYGEAAALFEKAGSFQDAEQLMQYAEASEALENGDYTAAAEGFRALGDFKDSVMNVSYCEAREQEAIAQSAFESQDAKLAVSAGKDAYERYSSLSLFRDSDERAAGCRDSLYTWATEWMNLGHYEDAAECFKALSGWQDCAQMEKYCRAAALEQQGAYVEAAEVYSEIPDLLDSASRAESSLGQAYQTAADLMENGDYKAAAAAFAELGDYRDAKAKHDSAVLLQVQVLLRAGSFHEALENLNLMADRSAFTQADLTSGGLEAYLIGFVGTWMNAHAGVMNAYFSCNLLQPFVEPGGELDTRIRSELTDEGAVLNYAFLFIGAETRERLSLDDGFIAAKMHGSASFIGQEGPVEMEENMWVLLDTGKGSPVVAAVLSE